MFKSEKTRVPVHSTYYHTCTVHLCCLFQKKQLQTQHYTNLNTTTMFLMSKRLKNRKDDEEKMTIIIITHPDFQAIAIFLFSYLVCIHFPPRHIIQYTTYLNRSDYSDDMLVPKIFSFQFLITMRDSNDFPCSKSCN